MNNQQRGFYGILLFYMLGLGGVAVLGQFMPFADMCNPGLPMITACATIIMGACAALVTLIVFLGGYRPAFVKGFLLGHAAVLSGLGMVVLGATYGA